MQRSEAQAIRREIVQFGTRENLGRMTPAQGSEYLRIRRESRDAMRAINNERDDDRASRHKADAEKALELREQVAARRTELAAVTASREQAEARMAELTAEAKRLAEKAEIVVDGLLEDPEAVQLTIASYEALLRERDAASALIPARAALEAKVSKIERAREEALTGSECPLCGAAHEHQASGRLAESYMKQVLEANSELAAVSLEIQTAFEKVPDGTAEALAEARDAYAHHLRAREVAAAAEAARDMLDAKREQADQARQAALSAAVAEVDAKSALGAAEDRYAPLADAETARVKFKPLGKRSALWGTVRTTTDKGHVVVTADGFFTVPTGNVIESKEVERDE